MRKIRLPVSLYDATCSITDTVSITVNNVAPTADAGGPYTVDEGDSVGLSGTGTDPVDTLSYAWDLDDNGSFETSGQNPNFDASSLDGPDIVTVTLQVSDGDDVATDAITVTVNNVGWFAENYFWVLEPAAQLGILPLPLGDGDVKEKCTTVQ